MKKRVFSALCSLALVLGLMPSFALADSYWPDPNPSRFVSGSVDKPVATVGDTVTISYDIADPDGVAGVSLGISDVDPKDADPNMGIPMGSASSGDTSSSFRYFVSSSTAPGKRWVTSLTVTDKAGWVTTIYDATYAASMGYKDATTADLSALTFEVVGTRADDPNPSRFVSGSVDKPVATVGDTVTISYDIADPDGVAGVSLGISDVDPKDADPNMGIPMGSASSGDTSSSFRYFVSSSTAPGKRWVTSLTVTDKAGWVTTIYDATYAASMGYKDATTADLSALTFEVVDPSAIPSYKTIEGTGSSYTQGSSDGLTFRFDAPADKLCSVEIDGKQVSLDCYTVRSGSTILTLAPAYLDTLAIGEHTVTAFYADGGRASATFKTAQKATDQRTTPTTETEEKNTADNKETGNGKVDDNRNSAGKSAALAETGDPSQVPVAIAVSIAAGALAIAARSRKRSKIKLR